jgi:hypothetical protein
MFTCAWKLSMRVRFYIHPRILAIDRTPAVHQATDKMGEIRDNSADVVAHPVKKN